MGTDPKEKSGDGHATRPATLSAARLAVAVRRAAAEAGESAALLRSEPIAIVGIGCRFPGGAAVPVIGVDEFWALLEGGRSGIREMPAERWVEARATLPKHLLLGGYLDHVDLFDAEFFGIAPREAHTIDPQQRLLLEVTWEALSDAGVAPGALSGTDAGVFVAVYNSDYARLQLHEDAVMDSQSGIGAAHSVASGRLSFLLNLRGPCMTVDTACSSSLVAAHLACQSLRRRECSVALVAGTSLKLLPEEVRLFEQWGMLAGDGQAKTFDARADGFVPGEGCGVVVLKRLSDAVAQGDRIHAVIRGSAMNHDGRSSVLTAPNGPAQEAVMRAALRDGQVTAGDVAYVETHGTGTSLGDPIEVEALDAVYGAGESDASCVLGAVKTNFGHLEAAAGVAGLIKTALVLEYGMIPRNLNFEALNPQIRWGEKSRLKLATEMHAWPRAAGQTRFAGVSSFGLGGTNAHVILEEAPVMPAAVKAQAGRELEWCLPVSAHTADGLLQIGRAYVELLRRPGADLGAVARSAARGRDHEAFRVAVSGASAVEVAEALETRLAVLDLDAMQRAVERGAGAGRMAFVFSGQGSLWVGALAALAKDFPQVAEALAECECLTLEAAGWSLKAAAADAAALADTAKAQPVLFALQVALLRVFEGWGIAPDVVAGHSVGEVAAAVAGGVLTLDEGMRLVLRRGRHMASAGAGRMLAAEMTLEAAGALVAEVGGVEIAAENGPRSVVFAGAPDAMERVRAVLEGRAVPSRWLDVEYAFHSAAMDRPRAALEAELAGEFSRGRGFARGGMQLVSTVTGALWQSGDGDAAYWGRGIRQPVRFREAVERLKALGCGTVVEIGPHPVLLRSVGECLRGTGTMLAAMRRGQPARAMLMALAGALYESGRAIDWAKVYPGAPAHAALPAYPWRPERYWLQDLPKKRRLKDSGLNDLESFWSVREVAAAFVDGRVFQARLGTSTTPWLGEHCWRGESVLPFTAWLEMARCAAAACAGSASTNGSVALREFAVSEKLLLGAEPVTLQMLVTPARQLKIAVKADDAWRTCAGGFWEAVDDMPPQVELEKLRAKFTAEVQPEALYALLESAGLSYGPSFRLLRSVWAGDEYALGEIAAGVDVTDGPGLHDFGLYDFGLHPAVLDACLQALQAAQPESERGRAMLPVSVRSYRVFASASDVFAMAELRRWDGDGAEADITIVDRNGVVVAQLLGLTIRRVETAAKAIAPMWQMKWTATESMSELEAAQGAAAPLMAEGSAGLMNRLKTVLEGDASAAFLSGDWDAVTAVIADLVKRERAHPGSVRRVCLVTCGAVAARLGDVVNAEQAALWGLMRSFRAEYPGIAVQLIDLPTVGLSAGGADDVLRAAGWMRGADLVCAEIAVRDGVLYLPQLKQTAQSGIESVEVERRLEIGTPGLLETLREEVLEVAEPGAGEVQIAVVAHGLNFRDVLTAMGTYAGVAAPMGAECAGVVVKAGAGATLRPGARVVAFAPASLRSLVNVPEAYCVPKPAEMSWAEAATVPVAFLTALYGFTRLAGLKAGDTVLVHAAAGGLGQAAVQLALRAGARVIATAGSEAKRAFLRAQGVEHVFDSRSEKFADDVLRVTDGRGVDVVLNSLAGEKIGAGLRALARGGAFLEVGKRDIWSVERVKAARPDAQYWAFDLGEVALREPELIQMMLREIVAGIRAGELPPLPLRTFAMCEAEQAFRWMAGGRHIGKLVLMREPRPLMREAWMEGLRAGTALITGGTGALGLAVARWLLAEGVRRVVLVSRGGGGDAVLALMAEFAGRMVIEAADVADAAAMRAVLERARMDAPLCLVVHAAGEVRDGLLADATTESLNAALRTKVEGAKVLAELTAGDDLLATVYYGSLTAVVGSAGQAGYAAANAYLDGMAEERSARGLRTLSLDWGAWAEGGMTERLSDAAAARVARQGIRRMAPGAALATMEEAILSGLSRIAAADVDWEVFSAQFPSGAPVRMFMEGLLPMGQQQTEQSGIRRDTGVAAFIPDHQVRKQENRDAAEIAAIAGALKAERMPRMETYVRGAARKVLGLSASRPMPAETALQDMGLDSLMALELRNVLAQAMGRPLSATLLFDYPTVRGLAGYLLGQVEEQTAGAKAPSQAADGIAGAKAPAYLVPAYQVPACLVPAFQIDDSSTVRNTSADVASTKNALIKDASMFEAELVAMSDAEAEELLLAELERKGAS